MSPKNPAEATAGAWKPHPDDERDVSAAMRAADRGDLLSVEASEAFVRWLEGSDDESWRGELE